jgi:hypothetical protein
LIKRERDVGVTRLMQEVAQRELRENGVTIPVMPSPEGWFGLRPLLRHSDHQELLMETALV